jgi:hypothetical protein
MKKLLIVLLAIGSVSSYAGLGDRTCGKEVYSAEFRGEMVLCAEVSEIRGAATASDEKYIGKILVMKISKATASNPIMDDLFNFGKSRVVLTEDLDAVCSHFGLGKYIEGTKAIGKGKFWVLSRDGSQMVEKKSKYVGALLCEPKLD